ncbi:MAG: hypothetical protein ACI3ZQ_05850 [Candidatus Cryptobacteroides sp.]
MKKYYVKSYFTGWHEVPRENYEKYIEHITNGAVAMPLEKRIEYVKTQAKIADVSEDTAVPAAINRI